MWLKIKSFLFENKTVSQTVAKNTFWLAVSNIGGRLIRALIIIYAARVLGAAEWGVFSYAVSLIALFTVFTDLGINVVIIREVVKNKDNELKQNEILTTSFFMILVLLVFALLIALFVAPNFTTLEGVKQILPIAAFILIFDTLRQFGFSMIQAMEKMEWEAGLYLLTNVCIVLFGALFLAMLPNITSFTYAYVIGTGIGMFATYYVLRDHFRKFTSAFNRALVKPLLAASWPFAIASIMGGLMLNTDVLLIGFFRSAEDVGFYSAAQRPIQLLYVLPTIIAVSAFPALSRMAEKENEKFGRLIERIISLLFMVALPIVTGGIILGQGIMQLLYGAEYLPGTASFQILLFTILANFPALLLSLAIFSYNKQTTLVRFSALGAISNVIFDLILIPKFGISGSAWATLGAQFLSNAYLWHTMKKIQSFQILSHLKKIFGATVLMAILTYLLNRLGISILVNVVISGMAYALLLVVIREPLIKELIKVFSPLAPQQLTAHNK